MNAGRPITDGFREEAFASGMPVECARTGVLLHVKTDAVARHHVPPLRELAASFVELRGGWDAIEITDTDGALPGKIPTDPAVVADWREWQVKHLSGLRIEAAPSREL